MKLPPLYEPEPGDLVEFIDMEPYTIDGQEFNYSKRRAYEELDTDNQPLESPHPYKAFSVNVPCLATVIAGRKDWVRVSFHGNAMHHAWVPLVLVKLIRRMSDK